VKKIPVLLALLALLSPALASAEGDAVKARKPAKVKYDPSTVVTLSGVVLGEQRVDAAKGQKGVRLVIKAGDQQVSVHLGPDTWVDRQKLKIAKGDEVTVKGSKFTYDDKFGVIAQTVTRGGETLVLRDAAGKPAWSGGAK
jgi:hypothetical protein